MKKSLATYIFLFAFLLSSCSSQKVATSSSSSSVYPTADSGHKKFVPGQTGDESESGSETMRLDSLKTRMAILEAQLEAIKAGESSKSKKAAQKEVAAINKEIEKVEEEVAVTTTDAPKNGQKKFVAKTKEEIAASEKEEKAAKKTPSNSAKKDTETAANTSKPKDKDTKTAEAPKTPSSPAKKDTETAANTTKKPTPKPEPKPIAPPKPQVVYKTITEKVLGNYFMDGSTSSQNMFCLHKTAPVGTQITVTNPMNGKQLTLKVLGKLPDLAEDMGVAIKITYSAARQLNLRDNRFELKCSYKMAFTVDPTASASTK